MSLSQEWKSTEESQEYQGASDSQREVMRNQFFQERVSPKFFNYQQDKARAKFDTLTAPRGDPNSGMVGDTGHMLASGGYGAIADLAQGATLGHANRASNWLRGKAKGHFESASPSMIQDTENFGITYDSEKGLGMKAGSNARGAYGQFTQTIGGFLPSLFSGAAAGKALSMGGKAVAGVSKASSAAVKATNAENATKALKAADWIDRASPVAGHGLSGGLQGVGGTSNQIYSESIALPTAEKMQSESYRNHLQASGGNELVATQAWAKELSLEGRSESFALNALVGAVFDPLEARILTGVGSASRAKNIAIGMASGSTQGGIEGGGARYLSNKVLHDTGVNRDVMEGVVGDALTGAALESVVSGGFAAAGRVNKPGESDTREALTGRIRAEKAVEKGIVEELEAPDLSQEERDRLEIKLGDSYKRQYQLTQMRKKAPTMEQVGQKVSGEEVQPAPETEVPETPERQGYVPADLDTRITNTSRERRSEESQYRRRMQNGGTEADAQVYEQKMASFDRQLALYDVLRNNRENQQYFPTEKEFTQWVSKVLEGGDKGTEAAVELEARKAGMKVDEALQQHQVEQQRTQRQQQFDQMEAARRDQQHDQAESQIQAESQVQAESLPSKPRKSLKDVAQNLQSADLADQSRAQVAARTAKPKPNTALNAPLRIARGELKSIGKNAQGETLYQGKDGRRVLQPGKKQFIPESDGEKRTQRFTTVDESEPADTGRYTIRNAKEKGTFVVQGAVPSESAKFGKKGYGGLYDADQEGWVFPNRKRKAVRAALTQWAKNPPPSQKGKSGKERRSELKRRFYDSQGKYRAAMSELELRRQKKEAEEQKLRKSDDERKEMQGLARAEMHQLRPKAMETVRRWNKAGKERKAFADQSTHIWRNPETGKQEPVVYQGNDIMPGMDLYTNFEGEDITGNSREFTEIEGRESVEDHRAREIQEHEAELKAHAEERKKAEEEKDARLAEQQRKTEEKEAKEQAEREAKRKAKEEEETRLSDQIKAEAKKEKAEREAKKTRQSQEKQAVQSRAEELKSTYDHLDPSRELKDWPSVRDAFPEHTAEKAESEPWLKMLLSALRSGQAKWDDTLLYADENMAWFQKKDSDTRYVIQQRDAADIMAWAELSGDKELAPVEAKFSVASVDRSYQGIGTPESFLHHLGQQKLPNPENWKGGWRGQALRIVSRMDKQPDVHRKPEKVDTSEKPVKKTEKPIHDTADTSFEEPVSNTHQIKDTDQTGAAEEKPAEVTVPVKEPRGVTSESGTFRETPYQRVADVNQVPPTVEGLVQFYRDLLPGDLVIDKFGNKRGVVATRKGVAMKVISKDEEGRYSSEHLPVGIFMPQSVRGAEFKSALDKADRENLSPDKIEHKTGKTTQGTTDETGRKSSNEPLETVPAGEVSATEESGKAEAGGGKSRGTGRRNDGNADGSGNEPSGSEGSRGEGADLPGAGNTSSADLDQRTGGVNSGASDFTIDSKVADDIAGGGKKTFSVTQRFADNIAAIKLIKELGDRPATAEQQEVLARYAGWGGLQVAFPNEAGQYNKGWGDKGKELRKLLTDEEYDAALQSTPNAHYTTPAVVRAIYSALNNMGVTHGRMLEPSVGVGNFIGLMPENMRSMSDVVAVEKDIISGQIASKLYPNSKINTPQVFEKFDVTNGSFDFVVANPPFGSVTITDRKRKDISGWRIHNYFLAKSMEALRPGGVMGVVVSKGFMDSSANLKGLEWMYQQASLVDAYRLPNDAFKSNANTDVTTDILFFQKREHPYDPETPVWGHKGRNDFRQIVPMEGADGSRVKVNEFFAKNPDKVLGDTITSQTGMYGPGARMVVVARDGFDWQKALNEGVEKIRKGIYSPESNVTIDYKPETAMDIHQAEVGGLYLDDSGRLKRREADREGDQIGSNVTGYTNADGKFIPFKQGDLEKLNDLLVLSRTARQLISDQVTEATDADLQPLRDKLTQQYDRFVKTHKALNRATNKRLLYNADPTIAPMILALERSYEKEITKGVAAKTGEQPRKEKAVKADIFTQRTQSPYVEVRKASGGQEGLTVALSQIGRVDMDYISELTGETVPDLYQALKGQVFYDPNSGWVTKDQYLSGNVKEKLRHAQEMVANGHHSDLGDELGTQFRENIEALESVQPEDIPATDIAARMGGSWQPPEVIADFWRHLMGEEADSKVSFVPQTNKWFFEGHGFRADKVKQWGIDGATPGYLMERLLNNKAIVVKYKDPVTEKLVTDRKQTEAANMKAQEIMSEFESWLWKDPQRRDESVRRYNDLMNTTVNRAYDGSHLKFPGKISDDIIKFRSTQANAIWRILQNPTTLLDHVVGAGKTFTMIGGAMELRRMGLAKKPVIVVPNHLVDQWAQDFALLYPNAKVLAASAKDFSAKRRKQLFARIATGDWDSVIVSHSSFGKLPSDPKAEQEFIEQQISDLEVSLAAVRESEGKDAKSTKEMANARDKMKQKLEALLENTDKDTGLTMQDMGIDALFVDEAHEFKNLEFQTSMNRVRNINPSGSGKSTDLFIKVRSIQGRPGGGKVAFATGTPISNSMAEMYTMQRYLGYDALQKSGLSHFDAWAKQFGSIETNLERKPSGKYEPQSRFAKFINIPELMQQTREFSDVINNDDIINALKAEGKGKHIPNIKGGFPQNVVAERSLYQEGYMATIESRFANMPDDPREDNPLKATNDARKAALDMRMIYPDLPDYEGSKINKSVNEMMRIYKQWEGDKGTQLVFSDLSTPKGKNTDKAIKDFREKLEGLTDNHYLKQSIQNTDAAGLYDLLLELSGDDRADKDKALKLIEKTNPDDIQSLGAKFDVYNDVKQKLMKKGVPEHEIAFIHDANTDAQKADLFDRVNSGKIRFLLGSTAKMGAGTNVQQRLVALHHLDAPWRPSDLEQREGRIIRQGNELYIRDPQGFEVEIMRYATEQTYDVNMWQTLEVKANFIQQIRNGDSSTREADDISGEAANAAEMKAASSGDPRILEQVEVQRRLAILQSLRRSHQQEQLGLDMEIENMKGRLERRKQEVIDLDADSQRIEPIEKDSKGNNIPAFKGSNGASFKSAKDAATYLEDRINPHLDKISVTHGTNDLLLGDYRGFKVWAEIRTSSNGPVLNMWLKGKQEHDAFSREPIPEGETEFKLGGAFTRLNNAIGRMEQRSRVAQQQVDSLPKQIKGLSEQKGKAFKYEQEYQEKKVRNAQLLEELGSNDKENEAAKALPEYQRLQEELEYYKATEDASSDPANELAQQVQLSRINRLMERLRYAKEGTEKDVAATVETELAKIASETKELSTLSETSGRYSLKGESAPKKNYQTQSLKTDLNKRLDGIAHVVAHESDLPQHLYDQIKMDDVQGRVKGVYDPRTDEVYVIAANADNVADGLKTALHEAVGHKGLRNVLGDGINRTLDQIYDGLPESQRQTLRKKYINQIAGKSRKEQRRIVAEEHLAHLAETDPQNNWVQRAIVRARRWLRDHFPGLKWSDAEARQLLIDAKQSLQDRSTAQRRPKPPESSRYSVESPRRSDRKMSVESARQVAKAHLQTLNTGDQIQLFVAESPKDIYGPDTPDFKGAITGGRDRPVLLVASGLHSTSADLRKTIDHEVLAHYGLAKFLTPKEKQRLLNRVKNSRTLLKPAWDEIKRLGYGNDPIDVQAEEVIAYIAENPPQWDNKGWRRIANAIVETLQKAGLFKGYVARKDIEYILSDIASAIHSGDAGNRHFVLGGEGTALAFSPNINTPRQRRAELPVRYHNFETAYVRTKMKVHVPKETPEAVRYRLSDNPNQKQDTPDSLRDKLDALGKLDKETVRKEVGLSWNSLKEMGRAKGLGILGGRQITEMYKGLFDKIGGKNPLELIGEFTQNLSAMRSKWANDADGIDQRWARLARTSRMIYDKTNDLMHQSTIAGVDPSKEYEPKHDVYDLERQYRSALDAGDTEATVRLDELLKEEAQRKKDHAHLKNQFEKALNDDARSLFNDVRDYYERQQAATETALIERLKGMNLDPGSTRQAVEEVRAMFQSRRVSGPYFPLMRFGQFAAIGETPGPDGKPFRMHFETLKALNKGMEKLESEGYKIESSGKLGDIDTNNSSGVQQFSGKLLAALDSGKIKDGKTPINDELKMAFMDEVNQIALAMMPELSAAKRSLHRKKVAGFDPNARRAFASVALHGANRLGRIQYGWRIQDQLDRIEEAVKAENFSSLQDEGDQKIVARNVLEEMKKRHNLNMNPDGHPLAAHIGNLAFFWYLGGSAAAGLVNMSQNVLVGLPQLGSRYGYARTSKAMAQASKDYFKYGGRKFRDLDDRLQNSWFDLSNSEANKHLSKDELLMIKSLIDDGTIDTTQAHTLASVAGMDIKPENQKTRDWYTKMMRGAGAFFHQGEVANRQIMALTAFRLYKEGAKGNFDQQKAVDFTRNAIFDAHFDYSSFNRPRHMKGNWAKTFLIFKQHSQNMSYFLGKSFYDGFVSKDMRGTEQAAQAKRALIGTLGLHAVFAGAMGLPGMSMMLWFAGLAMGDEDDPVDTEGVLRNFFVDIAGPVHGHALADGVFNAYTGIDIGSRIGANDLIIRGPGYEMPARQEAMHYVSNVFGGPAVSQAINMWVGVDEIGNGETMKGLQRMLPKFIRDGMKTLDYTENGVLDSSGKPIVEELTLGEKIAQAAGFSSSRVSLGYEARNVIMGTKNEIQRRKSQLLEHLDRAVRKGDAQAEQRVRAQIDQYNHVQEKRDREWALIKPDTIRRSLSYRKTQREESESGVFLPESQAGMREAVRFMPQ